MAVKSFYLTIQSGPEARRRVQVTGRSFLIGRDPGADMVIDDIEVSRRHARLIAQSDGFVIEDMGSTNGTYVNGERLTSMLPLRPGANIRLGDNVVLDYSVELSDEADTDPMMAAPEEPELPQDALPSDWVREPEPSSAPPEPQPMAKPVMEPEPMAAPPAPEMPAAPAMAAPKMEAEPMDGPAASDVPAATDVPAASDMPAAPASRARRTAPLFSNPWVVGCGILLLLGICAAIAFLWYVDANYLWCDVFGGLIPACR